MLLRTVLATILAISFVFGVTVFNPAPAQAEPLGQEWPDEMPPIDVAVLRNRLDNQGKWVQDIVLTIQPGGTLADASRVVYGDNQHVNEIFQEAKKKNPALTSPRLIPAGQMIELTIDPTVSFVLKAVRQDGNALVREFTNGVQETRYIKPTSSIIRKIDFPTPSHGGVSEFIYPDASGPVRVVLGGRVVDIRYRPPDRFEDVVRAAFGRANFEAASEFTQQTGWSPINWPPKEGTTKRLVFGPPEAYQPQPKVSVGPTNPDPAAQPKLKALIADREQAGIWAIKQDGVGILYRVAIEDPTLTAKDVARLLYGSEKEYQEIVKLAGFEPPAQQATDFNPRLFGRSFEIRVEYPQERFILDEYPSPRGEGKIIRLLNGTVIEQWQDVRRGRPGVQEIIYYPTGFLRVVYRPQDVARGIAGVLATLKIGGSADEKEAVEKARNAYAAELLWRFSPNAPRELGTMIERAEVRQAPGGEVMEILIAPTPRNTVSQTIGRVLSANPCLNVVGAVVLGSVLVMVVTLLRRRSASNYPVDI